MLESTVSRNLRLKLQEASGIRYCWNKDEHQFCSGAIEGVPLALSVELISGV